MQNAGTPSRTLRRSTCNGLYIARFNRGCFPVRAEGWRIMSFANVDACAQEKRFSSHGWSRPDGEWQSSFQGL